MEATAHGIRVELGRTQFESRILVDGEDVTAKLHVRRIACEMDANNPSHATVTLECYAESIVIDNPAVVRQLVDSMPMKQVAELENRLTRDEAMQFARECIASAEVSQAQLNDILMRRPS